MKRLLTTIPLCLGLGFSMATPGWASNHGAKPSAKPADKAPRLIMRDGARVWDNPAAFGPVPADQYERGVKVCATMNTRELTYLPTGYHAKAVDAEGAEYQGGGFYCEAKK
ncbi:MAG: hypothetical protein RLZZ344_569 [Pseudomonadota bacterium]|jgi:hypothetical protein